jgi:hypothetical protein
MHMGLGHSARRSKSRAPCFNLTNTLGRLCARREVEAKMDSSDELVDGMVYGAHEIMAYRPSGGQRAGEQQEMLICLYLHGGRCDDSRRESVSGQGQSRDPGRDVS